MADVLSRSEVESLLAALHPGPGAAAQAGSSRAADIPPDGRLTSPPWREAEERLQDFAPMFAGALGGLLNTAVAARLVAVEQLTFAEFAESLAVPTCIHALQCAGPLGQVLIVLDPAVLFPIMDRLLGGGGDASPNVPTRPLTEIERRLAARVIQLAVEGLHATWLQAGEPQWRVMQIESDPGEVAVATEAAVVLADFDLLVGGIRGSLQICVSFESIELLTDHVSSRTRSGTSTPGRNGAPSGELVVCLVETTLTESELAGLAVGDVIQTGRPLAGGMEILIDGKPQFVGHPGLLQGHKAVRVGSPIASASEPATPE